MVGTGEVPEERRVYRCEVEITDLSSGSSRRVPLAFQQVIAILPRARRGRRASAVRAAEQAPELPAPELGGRASTERIRLEDDGFVLDASTWEEFRFRLRERYPDDRFERRLRVQRDQDAEVRREEALQGLIRLFAEVVVDDFLKEQARDHGV